MNHEYFTAKEAEGKLGTKIQTLHEFSNVPKGTTGTIIAGDESPLLGHTLIIEWDIPNKREISISVIGREEVVFVRGGKPLVDWFDKLCGSHTFFQ